MPLRKCLGRALLERLAIGYGARPKRLTADAEEWLRRQSWPGNVRELGHLMERVTLLEPGASVDARGLERLAVAAPGPATPSPDQPAAVPADPPELSRHIGTSPDISGLPAEAQEVRDALVRTGGNVVRAARLLGVSRDTIRYRMRRHGLTRPELIGPATAPRPSGEGLATTPRSPDEAAHGAAALAPPDSRHAGATDTAPPRRESEWEQKMVAVSLAWTEGDEGTWSHEPWTEHQRWARLVREKLSGLGAVPLQDGASVSLWAVGLPRTVDQLLERAVHGALAIPEVVASLAPRERGPELRMAVHHGAMLVPVSAPDPARGALAVGDTIALSIALLGVAGPGEVVASADVGDRVAAWARVEQRHARGAALAGQAVYRIDGMRPWRERGSSRRLTPFVGRDRELALLEDLATAAATGAGQIAGIVAPPGAGKSRLLRELRRRLEARGIAYEEAHALAHGATTPLLPFVEMARSYFDVTESDGPEIVWPRVRAGLTRRGLDPDTEGPHLVALLTGQISPDRQGETAWRRTFDLVRHVVVAGSEKVPLVLAIDNAHWLDPTSEACIANLAEHLGGARCLFVLTYRPGYRPGWMDRSYATQVALAPLAPAESRRIVGAVAGSRALPDALVERVLAWAEGNPLFLEELTRAMLDASPAAAPAIPKSVQAVIAARIDRLAAADKRLFQVAAVIGREVSLDVLERVADLGVDALREGLARLQAAELLLERRARAVRTYGFKHAVTQAAAYQGVPAAARSALHARVLETHVALGDESRPDALPALAEHAAAAGDWRRALGYAREAGLRLLARDANHEAARCFEQALDALSRLGPGAEPDDVRLSCDLRFEALQALYRIGDLARASALATEAIDLAQRLGDPARQAQVLGMLAHALANEGRHADSMHAGERALALARAHGLTTVEVWAGIIVGRTCLALGRFAAGIEHLRRVIAVLGEQALAAGRAIRMAYGESLILCELGTTCVAAGRLEEAAGYAQQALALARERGERGEEAWALLLSGDVAACADPLRDEAARAWYGQAIALGEELGDAALAARARLERGALQQRVGRAGDGRRHLALAAAAARAMGIAAWQTRAEELVADARI